MSEYLRPLSPSSINTYLKCPYSFKLKYINKIKVASGEAAVFGSSIHKIMENFWGEYITLKDINKAMDISTIKYWDTNISEEYEIPKQDCLKNAIKKIEERPTILPLFTEYSCLNTDNNTIAIIDLVFPHLICDYKTSKHYKKTPDESNIIQATMCSMNLEKLTGKKIREVEFEYLRFNKIQYVSVTDKMISDMNILINNIRHNIQVDEFTKNDKACWFCDYKLICDAENRAIKQYQRKNKCSKLEMSSNQTWEKV